MSKRNCIACRYGASMHGFGAQYIFRTALKKVNDELKTIDYEKGECGCRKTEWNKQEQECLSNNFSKFEELGEYDN